MGPRSILTSHLRREKVSKGSRDEQREEENAQVGSELLTGGALEVVGLLFVVRCAVDETTNAAQREVREWMRGLPRRREKRGVEGKGK